MHPMKIAVIDHGYANIGSLTNALNCIGLDSHVISNYVDYSEQLSFSGFILPGVGSFGPAMRSLRQKKLDIVVQQLIDNRCRGMGICLGMQMLCASSEEDQFNEPGLKYFSGSISKLPIEKAKVPHIGWSQTRCDAGNSQLTELLNGIFYYIHSYAYNSTLKSSDVVASFSHGEVGATAAIYQDNLLGVQFHPEKSQGPGLALLKNYFTQTL